MSRKEAIFAAGCFWGVQYYFDQVPGVLETEAGYIGGHVDHPSYEAVCTHSTGHAEAVRIIYDPIKVVEGSKANLLQGADEQRTEVYKRYSEEAAQSATPQRAASAGSVSSSAGQQAEAFRILLMQFFRMHDPTQLNRQGPDIGDNYRSAIFYVGEQQKQAAQKIIYELDRSGKFKKPIVTTLEEAKTFWPAEDYHQKYTEKTGRGMCHVDYTPV
jgi:peptide methionine sulfoxide reductase MsrA